MSANFPTRPNSTPDRAVVLSRLAEIVGEKHVLSEPSDLDPHLREWRGLYRGKTLGVVRPGSSQEISEILQASASLGVTIVTQGGNTGLVGGQIPFDGARDIVLSTQRLNRIRDVDPAGDTMIVEAGVTLANVQAAADAVDRLFPLSLAAEGSCTIGGNIATNAGGTAVLAYGNTRDLVLGLEVVLADGRIWNGLQRLRKDNTGYDLKNLFIGSEGTLGVITAAALKLFPRPRQRATAFCAVDSPASALKLLAIARTAAGGMVTTFELMQREALVYVLRHADKARDPLSEASPWYVLIELSAPQTADLDAVMEALLAEAFEAGLVSDAAIAASLDQRQAFWYLRDMMSEVQAHEGGSIKHDISVPLPALPAFVEEASAAVLSLVPGCRPAIFGHVGDGNLHFNISQPVGADKAGYIARWEEMNHLVHAIATRYGGSFSAEHGIGRLKRDGMREAKDPVALDLMYGLKHLLDPHGLLNPDKMLPPR